MSLIERARFLASGQNDPHSVTIEELCAELEANAAEIGRKDAALKGGCNDFMGKPVKMIELMAHIRRFIHNSSTPAMKSLG